MPKPRARRSPISSEDTDAHWPAGTPDGLPIPRRYWSVAAIWLAMTMSVLDGAIANVALPTIAHELSASAASSIWIVNAYQLAITVTLLPLAALGDRLGYRRVYMVGLAVFTLRWRMPPSSLMARSAMSGGSTLPCQPSLFSISEKPLPLIVLAMITVGLPVADSACPYARSTAVTSCPSITIGKHPNASTRRL